MHVYEKNRIIILAKILRIISIVALVSFISSIIFSIVLNLNKEIYLRSGLRVVVTAISTVHVFLALIIFLVYESIYPNKSYNWKTLFKLTVIVIFLFFPTCLIVFRYNHLIAGIISALNFILVIVGVGSFFFSWSKIDLISPIKEIFLNLNSKTPTSLKFGLFAEENIEKDRKPEYLNPQTLKVFQEKFHKYSKESVLIAKAIRNNNLINNDKEYKVLDIGGFDGIFTSRLLEGLGIKPSFLKVIDPLCDVEAYKNKIKVVNEIEFLKIKFEDYCPTSLEYYDIIIASHSLYSFIDATNDNTKRAISQISSLLDKNGLIIVLLGSVNSPAYKYKDEVVKILYDKMHGDSTAEQFTQALNGFNSLSKIRVDIDNYLNVSEIISNNDIFMKWTSYFARLPIIRDEYVVNLMKESFKFYAFKANSLPICASNEVNNVDDAWLLHKTVGLLITNTHTHSV